MAAEDPYDAFEGALKEFQEAAGKVSDSDSCKDTIGSGRSIRKSCDRQENGAETAKNGTEMRHSKANPRALLRVPPHEHDSIGEAEIDLGRTKIDAWTLAGLAGDGGILLREVELAAAANNGVPELNQQVYGSDVEGPSLAGVDLQLGVRVVLLLREDLRSVLAPLVKWPALIAETLLMLEELDELGAVLETFWEHAYELADRAMILRYCIKAATKCPSAGMARSSLSFAPPVGRAWVDERRYGTSSPTAENGSEEAASANTTSVAAVPGAWTAAALEVSRMRSLRNIELPLPTNQSAAEATTIRFLADRFTILWDYRPRWTSPLTPISAQNRRLRAQHWFSSGTPNLHLVLRILTAYYRSLVAVGDEPAEQIAQVVFEICDAISQQLSKLPSVDDRRYALQIVDQLLSFIARLGSSEKTSEGICNAATKELLSSYRTDASLMIRIIEAGGSERCALGFAELASKPAVRKLRDMLIAESSGISKLIELALAVAKTYVVESEPVYSAWGLQCLLRREYELARQKIRFCLYGDGDRNDARLRSDSDTKSARRRIRPLGDGAQDSFRAPPISIPVLVANIVRCLDMDLPPDDRPRPRGGDAQDWEQRFQECIFYMRLLGDAPGLIRFLIGHDHLIDAVQFVVDQHLGSHFVVENFVDPTMRGTSTYTLTQLLQAFRIVAKDPRRDVRGLVDDVCSFYNDQFNERLKQRREKLRASRDTNLKQKQGRELMAGPNESLEMLRLFHECVEDWPRAALASIRLFVENPSQNVDDRLHYVMQARGLFSKAHKALRSGNQNQKSLMSVADVERYIKLCDLQSEILSTFPPAIEPRPQPVTLFGGSRQRLALVEVLLEADGDSFVDLAFGIVVTLRLPMCKVLDSVVSQLIHEKQWARVRPLLLRARGVLLEVILPQSEGDRKNGPLSTRASMNGSASSEYGEPDSEEVWDRLVLHCVAQLSDEGESKRAEELNSLISSEEGQIESLIRCGKLRAAYLLAVKLARRDKIERIRDEAKRLNHQTELRLCEQYLKLFEQG